MKLSRRHRKSHAGSHLLKDTRSRQTNGRAEEEAGLRLAMYCCRLETLGLEVWGSMIFMMVEIQKDCSMWVQMIDTNKSSCLQVFTYLHGHAHGAQVIER